MRIEGGCYCGAVRYVAEGDELAVLLRGAEHLSQHRPFANTATRPPLDDHAQLFRLLPVEQELAMTLTSAFQLVPEQSTAAIVLHHPAAKYYAVRGTAAVA